MQLPIEPRELVGRADVGPDAGIQLAAGPAAPDPVAEQRQDFQLLPARQFLEEGRPVKRNITERQARRAVERKPSLGKRKIAVGVVARIGHHHHMQMRRRRGCVHCRCARAKQVVIVLGIDVAADDKCHTFAEQRQRCGDPAADFQRLRFLRIADRRAKARAVSQCGRDRLAAVGNIDNDIGDPAATSRSSCHPISGLPPASSRGFGIVSDSGRILSPRPAARIIAFIRLFKTCSPPRIGVAAARRRAGAWARARGSARRRRADSALPAAFP